MAQTVITIKLTPDEYATMTLALADHVNALEVDRKDAANGLDPAARHKLGEKVARLRRLLDTL